MARQNILPNPALKLFEAYMDFSGGLNSETSNERLHDNEFPILDNVDLSSRGSAKRRTGRRKIAEIPGNGQGVFYYYRQNQPKPDLILAVSGRLYVIENGSTTPVEIPITDNGKPFTFQTTLPVEAVQYGTDMFVATGTKYVELKYDTTLNPPQWTAKTVTPYTPSVMEAIYIGTNGLADNPDAYVQDGISAQLEVVGIKPDKRTGVVNQTVTMVAYINKPASVSSVDYKWEYKKASDTDWTLAKDFTAGAKTQTFLFDTATSYDIRVTIRQTGQTTPTPQYSLTNYKVNQVEDKIANNVKPNSGIQRCRKIILHWDRIILSGDDTNPYQIYISDLSNPRYFPVTNTISFDTGKQEAITSMVRYRDMLVVFTKTTIQTLVGKSPDDYRRSLIHDGIGCVAERSAKVTGNTITFLSAEGIHALKPNQLALEVMNVQRIDYPIKSAIVPDKDACAMVYDSQYWLCFPNQSVIYRLYYDDGMWVRDKSSKLNLVHLSHYGEDVYELTKDGKLYQHDSTLYTDDGEVYDMVVESKFLDLSASFNYKKLKYLYVLAKHFTDNVDLKVYVKADSALVLTPESGKAEIVDGYAVWTTNTEPNMHFYAGTVLGSWILGKTPLGDVVTSVQKARVRGKCRRVKVKFVHSQATPCEIFGFGLEFKQKKP